MAILADPVFSADDPRIPPRPVNTIAPAGLRDSQAGGSNRPAGAGESTEFVRLRFSRTEADEIERPGAGGVGLESPGFRGQPRNRDGSGLRALPDRPLRHAQPATTSTPNYRHRALGSTGPAVHGTGFSGSMTFTTCASARTWWCSARARPRAAERLGEGLIGLTRGFLYAGSPRVVASLWEVDDRTTAELMKRFYKEMLGRGERPAAALRAAQTAFWRTKGWEAPYYWAAFTLQGEWK